MKLLITGATGFIGRALISRTVTNSNYDIYATVRQLVSDFPSTVNQWKFDGIFSHTDWGNVLQGVDCIIHAASRVHIMLDTASNPLEEFRNVNTSGTLNLARQAAELGVNRFIYLSSIKVNGETTMLDFPFTENDKYIPEDPYALSKYEAEQGLLELAINTKMEVVIIRPPLVYGPDVKANFLSMMCWLNRGIPLPFGAIHNKRSLVALDNLVDLISTCIEHPAAANQIFLAGDDEDLSTTELLRRVTLIMGKPSRLVPVPHVLLEAGLKMIGKIDLAQRLCASLQVDINKAKKLLDWTPPINVNEGLKKTVEHFINIQSR